MIGTHRLLSKDVKFHDLGLLVVDEEQRFGVAHKERLKEMRKNVDVLTMSATPIPRTLHMSLVGLRDMSVIETPPKDRLAIQTTVAPFSETLVQRVIEEELARGGQVFFVHNRVESIASLASMVKRLVPQRARGGRARADARVRARKGNAEIRAQRGGHSGFHDDHRERTRHPAREYDPDQPRGPHGAFRAVSVARARGPVEPARVRLPARAATKAR